MATAAQSVATHWEQTNKQGTQAILRSLSEEGWAALRKRLASGGLHLTPGLVTDSTDD